MELVIAECLRAQFAVQADPVRTWLGVGVTMGRLWLLAWPARASGGGMSSCTAREIVTMLLRVVPGIRSSRWNA